MKLIKYIYDHGVVMQMKFCQDILRTRGVIALDCLKVNEFWINRSYCLNFNEKISDNFGGGYQFIIQLACSLMCWLLYISGEVVFYNIFYEVFTVCTSLVAQNTSGKVMILTRLSVS